MPTRTIYLVRHGQEDRANQPDELQGSLTPLGVEQAQRTAERLRTIEFTAIHASTMRRADETAAPIIASHPDVYVNKTRLLWECVPNRPPGMEDAFKAISRAQVAQMQHRIQRAYDHYFQPATKKESAVDVLVCHGNLIRYFVCRVLDANEYSWMNLDIQNCGITIVEIKEDGRQVLHAHNDTAHLPTNLKTYI